MGFDWHINHSLSKQINHTAHEYTAMRHRVLEPHLPYPGCPIRELEGAIYSGENNLE